MLAFVIPVKHPARSHSYERVCDLLRQTLSSVEAQTDPHFATVVVCNQRPAWAEDTANRVFVEVDFPPAEPPANATDWVNWLYLDKGCKIAVGLQHAKKFSPTHVMPVDADDFVSNRLAKLVRDNPGCPGWYMPTGLKYSGLFHIAEPLDRFWSYCGTTHILRQDLLPVPDELGPFPSRDEVVASFDHFYLERILGCHVDTIRYFDEQGIKLAPMPFIGALYHADTGENASREWWKQSRFGPIWGTPLRPHQLAEFGVPQRHRRLAESLLLYGWRTRSLLTRLLKRARFTATS